MNERDQEKVLITKICIIMAVAKWRLISPLALSFNHTLTHHAQQSIKEDHKRKDERVKIHANDSCFKLMNRVD